MTEQPTETDADLAREKARLELDLLAAEIRKIEIETRKLARETFYYPIVAGTGVVLAIVAVGKIFQQGG